MKYLQAYKLFESKIETEGIVKEVMSKLPNGFYYRVKYGHSRGVNDRNISSAINEHGSIKFTIANLDDNNGKIWSIDKREIKEKLYNRFQFSDIKSNLEELIDNLPGYSLVNGNYTGYIHLNSTISGNDSMNKFRDYSYVKLELELRFNGIPTFSGVKSVKNNDIGDIFSDVFSFWSPDINIKESGDYYKIMSLQGGSSYDIQPMGEDVRKDLIESINRVEVAMDCNLISVSTTYRNYDKLIYSGRNFSLGNKSFNSPNLEKNKELAIDFIKSHEIIEFTLIFKKVANDRTDVII